MNANSTASPKGPAPLSYSTSPLNTLLCGLPTEAGETGFVWISPWQPGLSMLHLNGWSQNIIRGTCPMLIIALSVQGNYKKSINSLITPTVFVYITDETSGSVPWRSINWGSYPKLPSEISLKAKGKVSRAQSHLFLPRIKSNSTIPQGIKDSW